MGIDPVTFEFMLDTLTFRPLSLMQNTGYLDEIKDRNRTRVADVLQIIDFSTTSDQQSIALSQLELSTNQRKWSLQEPQE